MSIAFFPTRGLRLRLTVLFGGILAATLILFSILVYGAFVREQDMQFDAALYNHAVDVSHSISVSPLGGVYLESDGVPTGGKIFPFAVGKSFVQIISSRGQLLAKSRNLGDGTLPFSPAERVLLPDRGVLIRTVTSSELGLSFGRTDPRYRMITYLSQASPLSGVVLQIAVSLKPMEDERRGLRTFFSIAIPATLILSVLSALYLSSRALRPVGAIISQARQLSASRLEQRLPVPQDEDELQLLSETLNDMLDRLERAFRSQERFIADASHQLKTPLAIIRGELDVLTKNPNRNQSEIEEFMSSARQELDHLSRLVEDLLILARVDAGASSLELIACRLDEIAIEVCGQMERIAASRQIRLKVDLQPDEFADPNGKDFEVRGDPDLLRSAIQNLLDNAIKYSHAGGIVQLQLLEKRNSVDIVVKDHGTGIPTEQQQKIFERFFRGKEVNMTGPASGFGLGLSIAHRILDAHGSKLTLSSETGVGSTFAFSIQKS